MAKILLVEDDEDISENAALFLEHKGHQVTIIDNGTDGLEQCATATLTLLFSMGTCLTWTDWNFAAATAKKAASYRS